MSYSREIVFQLFDYHEMYFFKYNFNYEGIKMKERKSMGDWEKYIVQNNLKNKYVKKKY